jgi:hypothetical protein
MSGTNVGLTSARNALPMDLLGNGVPANKLHVSQIDWYHPELKAFRMPSLNCHENQENQFNYAHSQSHPLEMIASWTKKSIIVPR